MNDLARRVEAAGWPGRELDLAIATASYELGFPIFGARVNYDPALWLERNGTITDSLDAALTLVPQGCWVRLDRWPGRKATASVQPIRETHVAASCAEAATPALALCAAALRARLTEKDQSNG